MSNAGHRLVTKNDVGKKSWNAAQVNAQKNEKYPLFCKLFPILLLALLHKIAGDFGAFP